MDTTKLASLKLFIIKHRAKLAVGMTVTTFLLLMARNARQLETFMAEHNLLEEYHAWLTAEK